MGLWRIEGFKGWPRGLGWEKMKGMGNIGEDSKNRSRREQIEAGEEPYREY